MLRSLITALFFFVSISLNGSQPKVLVTIAPYRPFADRLLGPEGVVNVMVPPGASAHTFEPSPRHIITAAQSDIWFTMGEPFEARALPALQRANAKLTAIDLREDIELLHDHACSCAHHSHEGADPHFWLSPRRMALQVTTMAKALGKRDPDNSALYLERAKEITRELVALDGELSTLFSGEKPLIFLVSHPAYGYLAADYNLQQLSVEFEGKDPTPRELTYLLERARRENIKTVFIQPQYNTKGAQRVATELNAETVILDPFSEDYFSNLRSIAHKIAEQ